MVVGVVGGGGDGGWWWCVVVGGGGGWWLEVVVGWFNNLLEVNNNSSEKGRKYTRNEAELIKLIIEEVGKKVNPTHLNVEDRQAGPDQLLPSQIWQSQNCWPPIPPRPSYLFPQRQKGGYAQRVSTSSPIYLSALLKHLAAEVLELAGND
ncbi:hypothetical protein Vadar_033563 [Vaccinium darrowii]|uniref:Uncharacterized protein n=1 Tax=Vaccinium darrowii TaxID=229202 RepID=A0ACB7Y410_9ERIC|nr:hypothetical protein Vadar_033563 [Vaccinium darrowii]